MTVPAAAVQDALGELGIAMVGAGFAVTDIALALEQSARALDSHLVIGTLPSAILIDSPELERTRLYSSPRGTSLNWKQAAAVGVAASQAEAGGEPGNWLAPLRASLAAPPRYGRVLACVGSGLMSAGIAVVFGTSVVGMLVAAVFGVLVGAAMIGTGPSPRLSSLLPLACSFVIAAVVFALGDHLGLGHAPLYAVCAPLVMLIPGATITNGVVELAAGDMVSGSARIASGLVIWGMLTLGIIAGAAVAHVDVSDLAQVPASGFPGWAPWLALLVIALGLHLFFNTGAMLTLATVVSLELAYTLQTLIAPATGALVAAGVVAAVLLLVARIAERFEPRLPSIVTFRPAFWILVPGSLGLVTLTEMSTEQAPMAGLGWTVAATAVAIGIGVQVGAFVSELVAPRR